MRVFCIGNGESRKNFDLEQLRPHGKIYGCNRLYQDFKPDVLVSVDHGIMHEIYRTGFARTTPCYFRDWTKLPMMTFDNMVKGSLEDFEVEQLKKDGHLIVHEVEGATEYVYHGAKLDGIVTIIKKNKEKTQKEVKVGNVHLTQIYQDDQSTSLEDYMEPRDLGWSAGPTSGWIACKREEPTEVFLIGHDLNSTTPKVNNMYKGTKHYVTEDHHPTPSVNWVKQWKILFDTYKNKKFYKVNTYGATRNDTVNMRIPAWVQCDNVHYIDYEEMNSILGLT